MLKEYIKALKRAWQNDSQALKFFILTALFEGIVFGTVLMQESVCRLQFNAANHHITLVSIMMGASFFFALAITMAIKGRHTFFIAFCGIVGRGALVMTFFAKSVWTFLFLLFVYYSLSSLRSPIVTEITRNLFDQQIRGRIFSLYRMVFLVFSFLASAAAGRFFDYSADFIPLFFAFAGICGMVSFYYMILLCKKAGMNKINMTSLTSKEQIKAVFKNRDFFKFEAVFMIYGLAFMLLQPVAPIFLVNNLKFSYSEYSNARGIIAQGVIILFTPLAGTLFDKKNFHKITGFACFLLSFYPACLLAADYLNRFTELTDLCRYFAYSGFIFFGLGLTIIGIVWNLAGLRFSGSGDSAPYQAAHVTLVGIRGVLAPVTGYLIITFLSCRAAFITAIALWLIAGVLMYSLGRE